MVLTSLLSGSPDHIQLMDLNTQTITDIRQIIRQHLLRFRIRFCVSTRDISELTCPPALPPSPPPPGVRGQAGEQHCGEHQTLHPQSHRATAPQSGLQPAAEREAPLPPVQPREAAPVSHSALSRGPAGLLGFISCC